MYHQIGLQHLAPHQHQFSDSFAMQLMAIYVCIDGYPDSSHDRNCLLRWQLVSDSA